MPLYCILWSIRTYLHIDLLLFVVSAVASNRLQPTTHHYSFLPHVQQNKIGRQQSSFCLNTRHTSTTTLSASSTVYLNNALSTQSSAYATAGKHNTTLLPSPLMFSLPAIPSNTHTSVDTTSTTHSNAHLTHNTFPSLCNKPFTHAFSKRATPTTNKFKEQASAVSSHQHFAMSPSHSSNTHGKPRTTTSCTNPAFICSTPATWTTDTFRSTNNTGQHSPSPHWPILNFMNTQLK